MTDNQKEWARAKAELMQEMKSLGFRDELGDAIAKQLGSPKEIRRMSSYLYNVRPQSEELVVDEMLAICSGAYRPVDGSFARTVAKRRR